MMPIRFSPVRQTLLVITCCFYFYAMIFPVHAADQWVYFGTYTGGMSKGIYVSKMDADGKLTSPQLAASITNPSFLAVDSKNHCLYASSEVAVTSGKEQGD